MCTGSLVGIGAVSLTLASAIHFLSHSSTFFQKKTVTTLSWLLPQSKAIHTQTALKLKNENLLTKFCEKPTVYMP